MASKLRAPAPFKLTMPEVPEAAILAAVLQFLAYHPLVAWAERMNVGAAKFEKKGGGSQFVRFGFPGLTDILFQLKDGRIGVIECKARLGRITPEQRAFMLHVQKHNGVAGVARSVDDARAILAGRVFEPDTK